MSETGSLRFGPTPAAPQDLRRKTVRVRDGIAICPLPREHVVVGCDHVGGNLCVDYLAAVDAPNEVERRFRVVKVRNAMKPSRTADGIGLALTDVQSAFEVGTDGWYAFALPAREMPMPVSVAPAEPEVQHEQPLDPATNGASEGGA